MYLAQLFAHPAGRLLTLALIHFLWQGLAIAAVLVLAVDLGGLRRAAVRYACSLTALFAMTACPLATLAWIGTSRDITISVSHPPSSSNEPLQHQSVVTPFLAQMQALQPLALAAWLAGVTAFGGRLLAGAIGLAQLRRGRLPLPRNITGLVQQLGQRLQIDALPLVFLSRQVVEAMAVGVIRPLVLIPASWATEMPLEMLEAVIAHELAHLRRRDLWVNLLQRIVETLLFYHPAVWWLSRRLRIERELCADELAVAATRRRLEYAQALEQVAHWRQADIRPALAALMRGEQNMRVLERVQNVLGLAAGERSRLWPAGIVALALPLGLWLASLAVSVAVADDDDKRDKPAEKKRIEVRVIQRDGDRPRKEGPRDGDEPKKPGPRDSDVRKRPIKEEPKEEVIDRKIITRKGEPIAEDIVVKRVGPEAGRIDELTAMVKRLSAQVERLQDEVSALRGDNRESGSPKPKLRVPVKEKPSADEKAKPEPRRVKEEPAADEPSEAELRERKERKFTELKEAIERERPSKEEVIRRQRAAAEKEVEQAVKSKEAALKAFADRKRAAEKDEADKREIEKNERQ